MERVAVIHVDSSVRATAMRLVQARGLSVVEIACEDPHARPLVALAEAAEHAPFALVLIDAHSLQALGIEGVRSAALGDRPLAPVPVILMASRGARVLESIAIESVDELIWEPIDPRELGLRIESGLARRRTTELVAVASHELRSPLHAIVTFLDLLGRSEMPSLQQEMVDGARTASRHLLDIVEDLLEHAKLGQGAVQLEDATFSIRDVLREASSIALDAARSQHVAIDVSVEADVPDALRGDGPRVRQIVINLLSNALKFAARRPVQVRVRRSDGVLSLEVSDDGPGVPEHARDVVFEPFRQADASVTRRFGGTGLGLAIVRSLARQMGGDIQVGPAAADAFGAVFSVTLRLASEAEVLQAPRPIPVALVADADAIHRAITVSLLERLGYRVETVSEGVAALFYAIEHRPALVVLDLDLAVLDGLEVARRLATSNVSIPLVGFTLDPSDAVRAGAAAAGIGAVVAKPIAPLLFQRALRQATGPQAAAPRPSAERPAEDPSGERTRMDANRQMDEALRGMIAAVELHDRALEAAIGKQDLVLVAEVTRALRAAVIALNARGLEAVLRDVEQAARSSDLEECRRAHRSWRAALDSLRQNVDRFLVRAVRTS